MSTTLLITILLMWVALYFDNTPLAIIAGSVFIGMKIHYGCQRIAERIK